MINFGSFQSSKLLRSKRVIRFIPKCFHANVTGDKVKDTFLLKNATDCQSIVYRRIEKFF